jgi:hypothetical protein
MMMLRQVKFYASAGIILLICLGAWLSYSFVKNIQSENTQLITENSVLAQNYQTATESITQQQRAIEQLKEEIETVRRLQNDVSLEFSNARNSQMTVDQFFSIHDIAQMALSFPEETTDTINKRTNDAYRCFEIISGSPLTDEEKHANNNNINQRCANLIR